MKELYRDCVKCEISALDLRSGAQSDNVNMPWQQDLTSVRRAVVRSLRLWDGCSVAEGIDKESCCLFAYCIQSEPLSASCAGPDDLNSSLGIMSVDYKIWFDGVLFV